MAAVEDIREYDVPFHVRYAIDAGLRSGHWFTASACEGVVTLTPRTDLIFRGEPRVCAFDIETTKLPLHFPNSEHDQVCSCSLDRPNAEERAMAPVKLRPCTVSSSAAESVGWPICRPVQMGGLHAHGLFVSAGVHDFVHGRPAGVPHSEPGGCRG